MDLIEPLSVDELDVTENKTGNFRNNGTEIMTAAIKAAEERELPLQPLGTDVCEHKEHHREVGVHNVTGGICVVLQVRARDTKSLDEPLGEAQNSERIDGTRY